MHETERTRRCAGARTCAKKEEEYRSVAGGVRAEALDLAAAYRSQAVARPYLAHDVVDVILHSLFGDVQLRGNFFIGQPVAQKFHHLLLSATETKFNSPSQR